MTTNPTPTIVVFWAKPPGEDEYVSIQLQDGGPPAQFSKSYPHDEGYWRVFESYYLEDGFVNLDRYEEGRDCDGPSSRESCFRCHHTRLSAYPADAEEGRTKPTPDWEDGRTVIKDVYAQQMGY